MSKENQNDGVNRCRRCNRPLKDPTDAYGWWCAQIVGLDNYKKVAEALDDDVLPLYNEYVSNHLVKSHKESADKSGKIEKVTWMDNVKDGVEWASEKLESAFNKYKNALTWVWDEANEIQKSLQRKFWQIGSQEYLREEKGYLTSAWMLEHSLQDNPSDIWRGNDSRIAYLVNHDVAYLQGLDEAIAEAEDGKRDWLDNKKIIVTFDTGDLYYSLHTNTIYLNGYRREDGKWIVNARMNDIYDFTRITSFMGDEKYEWSKEIGLGTVANDVAVVSQLTGAIQPYYVTVDFWTVR